MEQEDSTPVVFNQKEFLDEYYGQVKAEIMEDHREALVERSKDPAKYEGLITRAEYHGLAPKPKRADDD